jgi:hypothetical protein
MRWAEFVALAKQTVGFLIVKWAEGVARAKQTLGFIDYVVG